MERTLSIIKPDATKRNIIGKIITKFESAGLRVVAAQVTHFTPDRAAEFYAVHKDRPFFRELVDYMCTGPIFVFALEGEDAVALSRKVMGATNYKNAEPGTIRAEFALSLMENAVHGSDSPENATKEIAFFFPKLAS